MIRILCVVLSLVSFVSVDMYGQSYPTRINPNTQLTGPLLSSNKMIPGVGSDNSNGLSITGSLTSGGTVTVNGVTIGPHSTPPSNWTLDVYSPLTALQSMLPGVSSDSSNGVTVSGEVSSLGGFSGPGTNLSGTATNLTAGSALTSGSSQILTCSTTCSLSGIHSTFVITLAGTLTNTTFSNGTIGAIYVFEWIQDSAGHHSCLYPTNTSGASVCYGAPNGITLQYFVWDGSYLRSISSSLYQ